MAGRPRIYDEEEVIRKAAEVFWEAGYEAASNDDVLRMMGIGRGSFYNAFKGGKQELYERSLEQFAKHFNERTTAALTAGDDPVVAIRNLFLAMATAPPETKRRGCYLGNAIVQLPEKETDLKLLATRLLKGLEKVFIEVISKARENGHLQTREHPELLARYLMNLWNGMQVSRRMGYTDEQLLELLTLSLRPLH